MSLKWTTTLPSPGHKIKSQDFEIDGRVYRCVICCSVNDGGMYEWMYWRVCICGGCDDDDNGDSKDNCNNSSMNKDCSSNKDYKDKNCNSNCNNNNNNNQHFFVAIEYRGNSLIPTLVSTRFHLSATPIIYHYAFCRTDDYYGEYIKVSKKCLQAAENEVQVSISMKNYVGEYVGIKNLGATCYINSLCQCLFYNREFYERVMMFDLFGYNNNNNKVDGVSNRVTNGIDGDTNGVNNRVDSNTDNNTNTNTINIINNNKYNNIKSLQSIFYQLLTDKHVVNPIEIINFDLLGEIEEHEDIHEWFKMLMDRVENEVKGIIEDNDDGDKDNNGSKDTNKDTVSINNSNKNTISINNKNNKNKIKIHKNMFNDLFDGKMVHTIHSACTCTSTRIEKFSELEVALTPSLSTSLAQFFDDEHLINDNQYYCERHGGKFDARKRVRIARVPRNLVIVVKRFMMCMREWVVVKDCGEMVYDECIDLGKYMYCGNDDNTSKSMSINSSRDSITLQHDTNNHGDIDNTKCDTNDTTNNIDSNTSNNINSNTYNTNTTNNNTIIYNTNTNNNNIKILNNVIVHSGTSNDGHYYTYIRINDTNNNNQFNKFNDNTVNKVSKQEVFIMNKGGRHSYKGYDNVFSAYVLVYGNNDYNNNIHSYYKSLLPQSLVNHMTIKSKQYIITNIELMKGYDGPSIFYCSSDREYPLTRTYVLSMSELRGYEHNKQYHYIFGIEYECQYNNTNNNNFFLSTSINTNTQYIFSLFSNTPFNFNTTHTVLFIKKYIKSSYTGCYAYNNSIRIIDCKVILKSIKDSELNSVIGEYTYNYKWYVIKNIKQRIIVLYKDSNIINDIEYSINNINNKRLITFNGLKYSITLFISRLEYDYKKVLVDYLKCKEDEIRMSHNNSNRRMHSNDNHIRMSNGMNQHDNNSDINNMIFYIPEEYRLIRVGYYDNKGACDYNRIEHWHYVMVRRGVSVREMVESIRLMKLECFGMVNDYDNECVSKEECDDEDCNDNKEYDGNNKECVNKECGNKKSNDQFIVIAVNQNTLDLTIHRGTDTLTPATHYIVHHYPLHHNYVILCYTEIVNNCNYKLLGLPFVVFYGGTLMWDEFRMQYKLGCRLVDVEGNGVGDGVVVSGSVLLVIK